MQCSSVFGKRQLVATSLAVLIWLPGSAAIGAPYTTTFGITNGFVEPTNWSVGDAKSTYQEWDHLGNPGDNPATAQGPDAPNPRGNDFSGSPFFSPGSPTLAAHAPIFGVMMNFSYGMVASGTNNFYALETGAPPGLPANTYTGARSTIFNYGTGDPGEGTHVIVQAGLTLGGEGAGIRPGSLQVVDTTTGLPITGGAAANATVTQLNLYTGITVNPPDQDPITDVSYEEVMYEFFLPGYFGDFRVDFDQEWSTTFDTLRIDSLIGPSFAELPPAPEPGTGLALLGAVASFSFIRRRRLAPQRNV